MHGAQQHLWMHACSLKKFTHGLIYIHIYIHIHMYIYRCIHAYIDIHIHTCTYTYIYAWIYIYIHMHIYVHIHICIYICTCTHVYIYLYNSRIRARATVQQLPCHGSYCELTLSLARTSCRLAFQPALLPLRRACCPPSPASRRPTLFVAPSPDAVHRHCSLKKSVQIHASSWRGRCCGIAQASSDHPHWCRPHPVCLWVALALGRAEATRHRNAFSPFSREFLLLYMFSCSLHRLSLHYYVPPLVCAYAVFVCASACLVHMCVVILHTYVFI